MAEDRRGGGKNIRYINSANPSRARGGSGSTNSTKKRTGGASAGSARSSAAYGRTTTTVTHPAAAKRPSGTATAKRPPGASVKRAAPSGSSASSVPRSTAERERMRKRAAERNMRAVSGSPTSRPKRRRSEPIHPRRKTYGGTWWAVLFVVAVIYFIANVIYSNSKPVVAETQIIAGSIDTTDVYSGILVRDESVYTSDETGMLVYAVNDGERVKKGDAVGSIQDADTVEELEQSLASVNQSIINMQATRDDYSIYSTEIKAANTQIKKNIENTVGELSTFSIDSLYSLRSSVQSTLDSRNQMLLNENRGSLTSLVQQKGIYEQQLASTKSTVSATESGIVCYKLDGLEDVYTFDMIENNMLTEKQTQVTVDYDDIEFSSNVSDGASMFKIVTSNKWYMAAYLPEESAREFNINGTKTIYIQTDSGYISVETTIYKNEDMGNGKYYTVFTSNKKAIDLLYLRGVKFKLTNTVNEGFKIPNTSIAEKTLFAIPKNCISTGEDNKSYVTKTITTTEGTIKEAQIEISPVTSDEDYAYIYQDTEGLTIGSVLVIVDDSADTTVTNVVNEPAASTDDEGVTTEGTIEEGAEAESEATDATDVTESTIISASSETYTIETVRNVKGVFVTNTGVAVFKIINLNGNSSTNSEYTVLDPAYNTNLATKDSIVADVDTVENKQIIN